MEVPRSIAKFVGDRGCASGLRIVRLGLKLFASTLFAAPPEPVDY